MGQQVFVPITDDLIYNHPELIKGPLIPYNAGMECQHWLSIEINPDETINHSKQGYRQAINNRVNRPSRLHLAYSA